MDVSPISKLGQKEEILARAAVIRQLVPPSEIVVADVGTLLPLDSIKPGPRTECSPARPTIAEESC